MSTIAERPSLLAAPATAARAVEAANDALAAEASIPEETVAFVRELAAAVTEDEIESWLAVDSYPAMLAFRALIEAEEAIAEPGDPRARDALRLALERLGHALATIAEQQVVGEERPAGELAGWLVDAAGVPQRRLAQLLGVDLRKLQRWLAAGEAARVRSEDERRLRTVARIVNQLRHVLSGPGVVEWFTWPRSDLGGRAPQELLADPRAAPDLLLAAASMRSTSLA